MGGLNVSRQRRVARLPLSALLLAALAAGPAVGCATTERAREVQRLQAQAAYERGLAHLRDREPALALSALQEAVGLDDSVPTYWNTLGWLYLQLGRLDEALSRFQKATELDPNYAEAHMNVGVTLAEAARWQEAVAAYRRALALPTLPTPHVAYQNLGLALYHLKRYREAEEALRVALRLDPQMGVAYYNLGLVLAAQNRRDEARASFRRAVELAPQSPFGQAASERLKALGEGSRAPGGG
jgi:Tfp pilus assembly protein PilF